MFINQYFEKLLFLKTLKHESRSWFDKTKTNLFNSERGYSHAVCNTKYTDKTVKLYGTP